MSSPPATFASSPISNTSPRRTPKSRFTFKQLHQLKTYSTQTPLRAIAHVDLDAFYAQCETVRLGIDPAKPLAVQQWQGLIAINYPARAYGLTRHITSAEALKACPELILQHVATWKEGDDTWSYSDEAYKEIATRKVSLDLYRRESRKILQVIKDALPEGLQKVEKASIDEVFMDLSAQVHAILLERYPELRGPPPYDDPSEYLPSVPTTVLEWQADALVETGEADGEEKNPDWDDVVIMIASEIVRSVRKAVFDTLGYTCSGGVASNKMIAKLGSAYKKPNQQTVIRPRAVAHFLAPMKFTKIRNLGGKLGDDVVAAFGTDKISELLAQPLTQLQRLGDDTGAWLYATIRGSDTSEVNPRTAIKSMLSAKSFRPAINSFDQGVRWLRIFVADIFSRCVEDGVLENKRRPRVLTLHHRQGAQTRSRQAPIPQGKPLSEETLMEIAKNLLAHVVVDGRAWPCANLSLSVGGFEEGVVGNRGIGGFLVRGQEAKDLMGRGGEPPAKRRKTKGNIKNFFAPPEKKKDFDAARKVLMASTNASLSRESTREEDDGVEDEEDAEGEGEAEQDHSDDFGAPPLEPEPELQLEPDAENQRDMTPTRASKPHITNPKPPDPLSHSPSSPPPPSTQKRSHSPSPAPSTTSITTCPKCSLPIPAAALAEHADYHFALELSEEMQRGGAQEQEQTASAPAPRSAPPIVGRKPAVRSRGRPPGGGAGARGGGGGGGGRGGSGGVEKGQAKLVWGRGT